MDYARIAKESAAVRAELRGQTANPELVGKLLGQCAITEAMCDEAAELLAAVEELLAVRTGDGLLDPACAAFQRGQAAVAKAKGQ